MREADIEEFPAQENLQGKSSQEKFGELPVTNCDLMSLFRLSVASSLEGQKLAASVGVAFSCKLAASSFCSYTAPWMRQA